MSRHTRENRGASGRRSEPGDHRRSRVRRKVDLGLLQDDPPDIGEWVLIHVGFAMSKINEEDALAQIRMLTELGETDAAMEEVRGYGLGDPVDAETRAGP